MNRLLFASTSLLLASTAFAQPAVDPATPLADLRDEKKLAQELAQITEDPTIHVTDPKVRTLAQALLTEGVKQLLDRNFDQALANFLEAYGKFPSAKILLNIAGTLRDMGRDADAANTYQRYLSDSGASQERIAEVTQILATLDATLTKLMVRVQPRGAELSIDGGPFVAVGAVLTTRVRAGIHMIRVRKGDQSDEVSLNGFEGEEKQITASVPEPATPAPPSPTPPAEPPEQVQPWLTNGTLYGGDAASNVRTTRATYAGDDVEAVIPDYELTDDGQIRIKAPEVDTIESGAIAAMRIDYKLRGFAGAFGLAISRGHFEFDALYLRSELNGAYLGARYRILTGALRPYVGGGIPLFFYTDRMDGSTSGAFGVRVAGGLEIRINGHLSVQGDMGYEHFFVDENETHFESNELVPTLGIIGRL